MNFYLAPLEGITGHIYRNLIHELFGEEIDKYFTPFFMPHTKRTMISKEIQQILPENNPGQKLVPQILTSSAEDFLRFQKEMKLYGYDEINLNLGCPSNTVANKGRGSGFLRYPVALREFMEQIFEGTEGKISVKTRLGWSDPDEFEELLSIYNGFPLEELIIHPRVRTEFYNGIPHRESFLMACRESKNPLVYNGDIWSKADYEGLMADIDRIVEQGGQRPKAVMLGRGLLANPALAREICGGPELTGEDISVYLERIREDYRGFLYGDVPVLYKLKEIWAYLGRHFPGQEKTMKKLMKSKHIEEYLIYEREMLASGAMDLHVLLD